MEMPRNHAQETRQSPTPEIERVTMPSDHPEKRGLFSEISDALRELGSAAQKLFVNENNETGVSVFQEFMANMLATFHGEDLETGITIHTAEDLQKAREIFRPIINLDETSIEFKEGDFIRYNAELGTVDFYPADKNQESGHSLSPSGAIPIRNRPTPPPNPESIPVRSRPTEKGETETSQRLGDYLVKRGAYKS